MCTGESSPLSRASTMKLSVWAFGRGRDIRSKVKVQIDDKERIRGVEDCWTRAYCFRR